MERMVVILFVTNTVKWTQLSKGEGGERERERERDQIKCHTVT